MKSNTIHFIGIGGCGMNGVAQLAAHSGYSVSGSDRSTDSEIFQCLEKLGIKIFPQDGSGITEATDAVVFSTAIENDNPDLLRARELDIPSLHRAEMLAKLCEGKEVIAVAGTAGKSTVTGLLGHIFQTLEKDPTVYCGASILRRSGISAAGQRLEAASTQFGSGPWIIEADESDKSFLHFHPNHAIITNIAEDHFELSELEQLFALFESQVSGIVIKQLEIFQGLEEKVSMLGKHNLENAANALTLCKALGLDIQKCIEAVRTFKGMERRLERIGPKVIDDFAHSPIKIAAALEAVSGEFETFNVVWRPHGFSPLFQGLEGFIDTFSKGWKKAEPSPIKHSKHWKPCGGRLFILPVYYAGGTVEKKITSEQFVEKLQAAGVPAEFAENFQTLEKRLLESELPVLIMGARDPHLPKFARQLATQLDHLYPPASLDSAD